MGRRPKPEANRRRHRVMIYLTDQEQEQLQTLSDRLGWDKTELLYEGMHTVFEAINRQRNMDVPEIKFQEYQDNSLILDGQTESYEHNNVNEWRPGFPCKVRFFAPMYARQRGIIRTVGDDHCMVQLNGQDHEVKILMEDLMYWDDEDEAWASLPSTYYDDEDLNSAEHGKE